MPAHVAWRSVHTEAELLIVDKDTKERFKLGVGEDNPSWKELMMQQSKINPSDKQKLDNICLVQIHGDLMLQEKQRTHSLTYAFGQLMGMHSVQLMIEDLVGVVYAT